MGCLSSEPLRVSAGRHKRTNKLDQNIGDDLWLIGLAGSHHPCIPSDNYLLAPAFVTRPYPHQLQAALTDVHRNNPGYLVSATIIFTFFKLGRWISTGYPRCVGWKMAT